MSEYIFDLLTAFRFFPDTLYCVTLLKSLNYFIATFYLK